MGPWEVFCLLITKTSGHEPHRIDYIANGSGSDSLTASDVLANFDTNLCIRFSHVLNDVIRIVYAVHLMLIFPVIHYSLRQTIDGVFFPRALALAKSNLRFAILTSLLSTLVFIGSTVVPNIWIAFQFTGATIGLTWFHVPSIGCAEELYFKMECQNWSREPCTCLGHAYHGNCDQYHWHSNTNLQSRNW